MEPHECGNSMITCPKCKTEYLLGYHGHCPQCCVVEDHGAECTNDVDYGEPTKPYWFCESCGYKNTTKAMPPNRDKFYARVHEKGSSPICPKCKSESFMPVGY